MYANSTQQYNISSNTCSCNPSRNLLCNIVGIPCKNQYRVHLCLRWVSRSETHNLNYFITLSAVPIYKCFYFLHNEILHITQSQCLLKGHNQSGNSTRQSPSCKVNNHSQSHICSGCKRSKQIQLPIRTTSLSHITTRSWQYIYNKNKQTRWLLVCKRSILTEQLLLLLVKWCWLLRVVGQNVCVCARACMCIKKLLIKFYPHASYCFLLWSK
jgi:hypothetical protein